MKRNLIRPRRGLTLVEVMITMLISAIVLLAVIYGIIFALHAQKLAREHSLAQRHAAGLLEEARNIPFNGLTTDIDDPDLDTDDDLKTRSVLIDDQRNETAEDDLLGNLRLYLFAEGDDGTLQLVDNALFIDDTGEFAFSPYLIVQAEVTWRSGAEDRHVSLVTHFAP